MVLAELDEVRTLRRMEIAAAVDRFNEQSGAAGLGADTGEDKQAKLTRAKALMESMVAKALPAVNNAAGAASTIKDQATRGAFEKNLQDSARRLIRSRDQIAAVIAGKASYADWLEGVRNAVDQAKLVAENRASFWVKVGLGDLGQTAPVQESKSLWQKILDALKGVLGFIGEAGKTAGGLIKDVLGGVGAGISSIVSGPLLMVGGIGLAALFLLPKVLGSASWLGPQKLAGYERRRPRLRAAAA